MLADSAGSVNGELTDHPGVNAPVSHGGAPMQEVILERSRVQR
ncbi:MAG TPA: hypothetical protein PLF81_10725 [Candidatus Anammoximicrobium sp.]|nr:hypothetical protein [Candidatus Anammoximicrobium sp.]